MANATPVHPPVTRKYGFFLIDGFPLMSVASAIEPLRAANLFAREAAYETVFLSMAGGPVASSSGVAINSEPLRERARACDVVFVVAGGDPMAYRDARAVAALRDLAVHGAPLGGISGGPAILAKAGLMEGRRFTVHWEHLEPLRAFSDALLLERRIFVIDRDRYTCAGGVAPLDMMHALIARERGARLATAVSDWFIHTGIRGADAPQRSAALGAESRYHRSVAAALTLMESHIADPLSLPQIARLVGASPRQLQRRFAEDVGLPVARVFMEMRLEKADELVRQTRMPIIEVAMATGFCNQTHFSRVFRERFGQTPTGRRAEATSRRAG